MEEYLNKRVAVVTQDGRFIVVSSWLIASSELAALSHGIQNRCAAQLPGNMADGWEMRPSNGAARFPQTAVCGGLPPLCSQVISEAKEWRLGRIAVKERRIRR